MNKAQIIEHLALRAGISKNQAAKQLGTLLTLFTETLEQGEKVQIVGFGSFAVAERAAREVHNPATGQKISLPVKKVVRFKLGKALADSVAQ